MILLAVYEECQFYGLRFIRLNVALLERDSSAVEYSSTTPLCEVD